MRNCFSSCGLLLVAVLAAHPVMAGMNYDGGHVWLADGAGTHVVGVGPLKFNGMGNAWAGVTNCVTRADGSLALALSVDRHPEADLTATVCETNGRYSIDYRLAAPRELSVWGVQGTLRPAKGMGKGLSERRDFPMKAIVFEIEKFATHDGPGIRTVVFLKGCPLRCKWCHSPESWKPQTENYPDGTVIGCEMTSDEVLSEVVKDRDFYEASGGGLTVSGGEPLFRWEFVAELLGKAKAAGLQTAVETSGYAPRTAIESVAKVCDLWLYDIKGMDAARHKEHTGVDNEAIHRNLRWLDANGAKVVLRCPMIPGVNDFPENLSALGKLADELKSVSEINVEPYVAYGIDKALKLGLKVYEVPSAPCEYANDIVARLAKLTAKPVRKG